jgi:hypothetical protein
VPPISGRATAKLTTQGSAAVISYEYRITAVRFSLDLPPSRFLECVVYGVFTVSTI